MFRCLHQSQILKLAQRAARSPRADQPAQLTGRDSVKFNRTPDPRPSPRVTDARISRSQTLRRMGSTVKDFVANSLFGKHHSKGFKDASV
jgi:hypothetical protein